MSRAAAAFHVGHNVRRGAGRTGRAGRGERAGRSGRGTHLKGHSLARPHLIVRAQLREPALPRPQGEEGEAEAALAPSSAGSESGGSTPFGTPPSAAAAARDGPEQSRTAVCGVERECQQEWQAVRAAAKTTRRSDCSASSRRSRALRIMIEFGVWCVYSPRSSSVRWPGQPLWRPT